MKQITMTMTLVIASAGTVAWADGPGEIKSAQAIDALKNLKDTVEGAIKARKAGGSKDAAPPAKSEPTSTSTAPSKVVQDAAPQTPPESHGTRRISSVDMLGVKLGISEPADAEAALTKQHLQSTRQSGILSTRMSAGDSVKIPKSDHVAFLVGLTERMNIGFAAPPSANKALWMFREKIYPPNEPMPLDNLLSGLREKYGEQNLRVDSRSALDLYWAYDRDGSTIALSEKHPCSPGGAVPTKEETVAAQTRDELAEGIARSKRYTAAGCAATVHARLAIGPNNSVTSLFMEATNYSATLSALEATKQYIAEATASLEQQREMAAKAKKPDL